MTTTQINYENMVNINQIRTDVLIELTHNLHRTIWNIIETIDTIEKEIERREQPIEVM